MVRCSDVVEVSETVALGLEPPNLVVVAVKGDILVAHVEQLFDRIDGWVAAQPFWLLEVDIEQLSSASADTRRVAAERMARLPPYSMTVHGGGFAQRTLARVFFGAIELLLRDRDNRHKVCANQEESRAWLATESERHQLRGGGR